jgi:hypothetical protein
MAVLGSDAWGRSSAAGGVPARPDPTHPVWCALFAARRVGSRWASAAVARAAVATHLPPHRTRIGRTLPLAKKDLTNLLSLCLALSAGVLPSYGAGTRRATVAERVGHQRRSGRRGGGAQDDGAANGRPRRRRATDDGAGGVPCPSPRRPPGTLRAAPAPPPPMSCSQRRGGGASSRPVRGTRGGRGTAERRGRRRVGERRHRQLRHRAALSRASRRRASRLQSEQTSVHVRSGSEPRVGRRTSSLALAVAGVISGRTSASGHLYASTRTRSDVGATAGVGAAVGAATSGLSARASASICCSSSSSSWSY